jgi:peptidoglycan/LPS O-acetylase OafA/YrhL
MCLNISYESAMQKDRLYTLDAMRGIAALAVLGLHIGEVMQIHTFHYAYLAVDLFFMLSGFVLARSYEHKLAKSLSARRFMEMRLIRLFPMFFLGVCFGVFRVVGQIATHDANALSPATAVISFGLNALMLPSYTLQADLFPFDPPAWSLFFELIINAVFCMALYRFRTLFLLFLSFVLGVLFIVTIYYVGNGHFGPQWNTAALGVLRVSFCFPAGMLIARFYKAKHKRPSVWSIVLLVVLTLILVADMPTDFDWIYDSAAIFIAMPALLWLGAKNELPKWLEPVGDVLGEVSYPLYAVHYPLLQVVAYLLVRRLHFSTEFTAIGFAGAVVIFSFLLAKFADLPIRKWISRKLHVRASATVIHPT